MIMKTRQQIVIIEGGEGSEELGGINLTYLRLAEVAYGQGAVFAERAGKFRAFSQRCSAFSRSLRNVSRSFAAGLIWANCQMPQKYGPVGVKLPLGPVGAGKHQQSSAILGASRLATA